MYTLANSFKKGYFIYLTIWDSLAALWVGWWDIVLYPFITLRRHINCAVAFFLHIQLMTPYFFLRHTYFTYFPCPLLFKGRKVSSKNSKRWGLSQRFLFSRQTSFSIDSSIVVHSLPSDFLISRLMSSLLTLMVIILFAFPQGSFCKSSSINFWYDTLFLHV